MEVAGVAHVRIQGEDSHLANTLERNRQRVQQWERATSRGYGQARSAATQFGTAASGAAARAAIANDNVTRSTNLVSGAYSRLASVARGWMGTVGAVFGVMAVGRTLASFEQSIAAVGAVARASAEQMEAFREVSQQMGATTEFTASQAAEGLRFLAMAGFEAEEAMTAIPDVLDLATAGTLGLAEAADIVSNIMTAFGVAAENTADVTDVMAAVAARANTNIFQLGDAMKFAAPLAAGLDISISSTAAAIGVLSDAGIQGSMAGTGLRMTMIGLANATPRGREVLESLGLTMEDVSLRTNTLAEVMETLAEAGLTAEQAMEIAGARGGNALQTLAANAGRLRELSGELENVEGATAEMAERMRDNLAGAFNQMKAAIESLVLALGEAGLTSFMRSAADTIATVARTIRDNLEVVGVVVAALVGRFVVTPILIAFSVFINKLALDFQGLTLRVIATSGALTGASRAMIAFNIAAAAGSRIMAFFGGPLGLAVTAIAVGIGLMATRSSQANVAMDRHRTIMNEVAAAYERAEGHSAGLLDNLENIQLIDIVDNFDTQRDAYRRLQDEVGRTLAFDDRRLFEVSDNLVAMGVITEEIALGYRSLTGELQQMITAMSQGGITADTFAAYLDDLAVRTAGATDAVGMIIHGFANSALEAINAENGIRTVENALIEAIDAMSMFEEHLTDGQRAMVSAMRGLLELAGAYDNAGSAAAGATGPIVSAGNAAGASVGQFLAAAHAVEGYAAALRALTGIAGPEPTQREQALSQYVAGREALAEAARLGPGEEGGVGVGVFLAGQAEIYAAYQNELTEIAAEESARRQEILQDASFDAQIGGLEGQAAAVATVTRRYQELRQELVGLNAGVDDFAALDASYQRELQNIANQFAETGTSGGGGGGGGGGGATTSALALAVQSVRDRTSALRDELAMLGMTERAAEAYRVERELINAAMREGVALSASDLALIRGTAEAYAAASEALREHQDELDTARERMQNWQDTTKSFFSTFISGMRQGQTAAEALGNAFGRLADRLIDAALNFAVQALFQGLSNLGGSGNRPILGALFANVMHNGGVVGETSSPTRQVSAAAFATAPRLHSGLNADEFPAILQKGEQVIPKNANTNAPNVFHIETHIDARGSQLSEQELKQLLRQHDKQLEERLPALIRKQGMNRRYG